MKRPERQRNNLVAKVAEKATRTQKKAGKRTKRWNKWIEKYKPVDAAPAEAAT